MNIAELDERGARALERPWGVVVLTCFRHNLRACGGCNTERFREAVYPWLKTAEGQAWRLTAQLGGAS